jgi:hypothetical protein
LTAAPPDDPVALDGHHRRRLELANTVCRVLDLRPHERSVLRYALWARLTGAGSGNYLVPPGSTKSSRRVIDKGYATKVDVTLVPDHGWLVVKVTDDNVAKITGDYNAKVAAARRKP